MRGLNRLAMVLVLAVGLLGLTVAAGPPLGMVSDGRGVTGGDCYVAGTEVCNVGAEPDKLCEDTSCEPIYPPWGQGGTILGWKCPAGTTQESWNSPGTYEKAKPAAPGEAGKVTYNPTGQYKCKTSRTCTAAGQSSCDENLQVPVGHEKRWLCKAGATNPVQTDPRDKSVPDGAACVGAGDPPS
jgi:hypothetical protein